MEPFTIRCETCRAKLRVRDQRVLGQIHECPRCGSMVLIAMPAATGAVEAKTQSVGAVTSQESITFSAAGSASSADVMFATAIPESHAAPPAEAPRVDSATATFDWSYVAIWSAGGAALFIAGGIVGAILLGGGNLEAPPAARTAEIAEVRQPALPKPKEVVPLQPERDFVSEPPPVPSAELSRGVESEAVTESDIVDTPSEQPPASPVVEPQPASVAAEIPKQEPERKLTLDPVPAMASMSELAAELEAPAYTTVVEPVDVAPGNAKSHADIAPRAATNIDDQLAMPVAGLEINAMPLASFVETISEMSAVPIVLDDASLKAVGATARTKVSVRAGQETIESLLTSTLSRHKLAWEERDGQIVIVPAR